MKIDEFTKDEQAFLLGNLSQMTVTGGHPEFLKVACLLDDCIQKLKNSLGVEVSDEKKPLASAARTTKKK